MEHAGPDISFRTLLLLLFLPLLLATVGLNGLVSHRAGQRSVHEIADHLGDITTARIIESVETHLALPLQITRRNAAELEAGVLDAQDTNALMRHFGGQVLDNDRVAYVFFGDAQGRALGVERELDDSLRIEFTSEPGVLQTWSATPQLEMDALLDPGHAYDPRNRPWYTTALEADGPTWSPVYSWEGRPLLCVDAVQAVHDADGAVVGVVDSGYTLGHLSEYLRGLEIGRTGVAYLVEPSGLLIASSAGPVAMIDESGVPQRLSPAQQDHPLVRRAAERMGLPTGVMDLRDEDHALGALRIEARPLGASLGLPWTLVVALPESDFTAPFDESTRTTLVLSVASLLLAVLAALVFAHRLSRPLVRLTLAAERVREGDLNVELKAHTRDEIGRLTETMGEMVKGLRERALIQDAFGRYVTREVAEQVLSNPDGLALGGSLQTVTILMSDLRSFTPRAAGMTPPELVALLNRYLGHMSEVILHHDGLIVEFIGDAILVLFGAPNPQPDDAERAGRCALEMQTRLDALNRELVAAGISELQMGIALHTGEVVVGNIGSEHRVKYGVVGDAVNRTSRIEGVAAAGQVVISSHTRTALGEAGVVGPAQVVHVKGIAEELHLYLLSDIT